MLPSTRAVLFAAATALLLTTPGLAAPYFGPPPGMSMTNGAPTNALMLRAPLRVHLDPRFMRQVVPYQTAERAGTLIVDTEDHFLYLVLGQGKALRYGIGTARTGFEWSGIHTVTNKREWPDWTPPVEMLARRPDIPTHMAGGANNPLGARALYIGATLYRIHGTNEPNTIGQNVSSGCIRMMNEDVTDLYGRVGVGTRVLVM